MPFPVVRLAPLALLAPSALRDHFTHAIARNEPDETAKQKRHIHIGPSRSVDLTARNGGESICAATENRPTGQRGVSQTAICRPFSAPDTVLDGHEKCDRATCNRQESLEENRKSKWHRSINRTWQRPWQTRPVPNRLETRYQGWLFRAYETNCRRLAKCTGEFAVRKRLLFGACSRA